MRYLRCLGVLAVLQRVRIGLGTRPRALCWLWIIDRASACWSGRGRVHGCLVPAAESFSLAYGIGPCRRDGRLDGWMGHRGSKCAFVGAIRSNGRKGRCGQRERYERRSGSSSDELDCFCCTDYNFATLDNHGPHNNDNARAGWGPWAFRPDDQARL